MVVRSLEARIAALQEDLTRSHPEVDFHSQGRTMQRAVNLALQVAPPMLRYCCAERAGREKPSWPGPSTVEQPGQESHGRCFMPFPRARAP